MSKTYLVKWKALEFYFLSGEKNFGYGANRNYNGNPYFIHSLMTPTPTTLLGTIRYEILRRLNCLNDYTVSQIENLIRKQAKLVGSKSFNLSDEELKKEWEFGIIKKISPLFIVDGDDYIIKAPYHKYFNKDVNSLNYVGRCLKQEKYELLDGINKRNLALMESIKLKEEYKHRSFYYSINNKKLVKNDSLFLTEVRVGINTKDAKDGFFKKEYCRLKPKYDFAVLLELDENEALVSSINENNRSIVYMGMSKSAFVMTIEEIDQTVDSFEEKVKDSLKMENINDYSVYYALSDIYVDYWELSKYCSLILGDCTEFRNLTTKSDSSSHYNRFSASDLHYMMNKGSVFFVEDNVGFEKLFKNNNLNNIGFNKVIKIGGK